MNSERLPLLSIVIPTKNGADYISDALDSIYRQDYPHFEVIVIDGNSTDKTCEIVADYIKRYPNIRLTSENDLGQSDAMNKGIKASHGEIIGFLNDDDFYSPGCFKEVISIFSSVQSPALVVGNCRFFDKERKQVGRQQPRWLGLENFILARQPHPANSSQYFYHKMIHQLIGDYPINEHLVMDLWFYLECCTNRIIKLEYVNRDWGNFRVMPRTKTWDSRMKHAEIRETYKKKYFYQVRGNNIVPALYRGFVTVLKNKLVQLVKKTVLLELAVCKWVRLKEGLKLNVRCRRIRRQVKGRISHTAIQKLQTDKKLVVLLCAFAEKRFPNLPLLLQSALKCEFIEQIIISNNNSSADISREIKTTDPRFVVINQKENRNCAFRIEMLAGNNGEYFAVIDDDLFLMPEQIRLLFQQLLLSPQRVHGCYGENHFDETVTMPYLRQRLISQNAPVEHVGRVYFFSRETIKNFIAINSKIKTSYHDDLVLSFSGTSRPLIHDVGEVIDCPTAHLPSVAISRREGFTEERTRVLRTLRTMKANSLHTSR